jgi:transposase
MRDVGEARTRQDAARLLGGHRNSIGCWLTRYETGGLRALLARYLPAGKPLSLSPAGLAAVVQALQQPAGFASYEALRQRGQQTSHREVNYRTLYTIIHTKFKATLKVPRPSHTT